MHQHARPLVRVVVETPCRRHKRKRPASQPAAHGHAREETGKQPAPSISTRPSAGHLTFGLRSSCERGELMLALVMRVAPVSTVAGTCAPFEAASAVLTPS